MTTPDAPRVLRWGVAGLGRAFTLMLPTLVADPRVRLVAAADPRTEARERFAADFGAPRIRDGRGAVRTIRRSTSSTSRRRTKCTRSTRCVRHAHGKHVLVEKPMALTLDDCTTMIDAADSAGVQLVVGHSHSFDAPIRRTREIIDSGAFGAVRMIQAFNYTDFLYRPRRPEELDTTRGGGVVFSQAAHQVDIVRLLGGGVVTGVRALDGQLGSRTRTRKARMPRC